MVVPKRDIKDIGR